MTRPSLGSHEKHEIRERKTLDNIKPGKVWTYIQSQLVHTTEMPQTTAIKYLLALPRLRDVQYNAHHRRREFVEAGSRDIAAIIIQVTGDEASTICNRCRQGRGPFQGCIVVPQSAHPEAKRRYPCCGNCLYGGKKLHCSLMKWIQKRDQSAALTATRDLSPTPAPAASSQAVALTSQPTRSLTSQPSTSPGSVSHQPASSALISQGTFQDQDALLEMEDWEVAPGRIRETANTEPESKPNPYSFPLLFPPSLSPFPLPPFPPSPLLQ